MLDQKHVISEGHVWKFLLCQWQRFLRGIVFSAKFENCLVVCIFRLDNY